MCKVRKRYRKWIWKMYQYLTQQKNIYDLLGHFPRLHCFVSMPGPRFCCWHVFPLAPGAGFVQVLFLTWAPFPHETVHVPHAVQSEYPPGNGVMQYYVSRYWTFEILFVPMLDQHFLLLLQLPFPVKVTESDKAHKKGHVSTDEK